MMELALLHEVVGVLLAALIAVVPPIPHPQRERIQLRKERIVAMATGSSARYRVPPSVLLVVAFLETHLGTDDGEGGGWGAPIDAQHPHKAGTSDHAARILARGRKVCGSWEGAVSWFRSGQCSPPPFAQKYVYDAVRLVERMHRRAALPVPEHLYAPRDGQGGPRRAQPPSGQVNEGPFGSPKFSLQKTHRFCTQRVPPRAGHGHTMLPALTDARAAS